MIIDCNISICFTIVADIPAGHHHVEVWRQIHFQLGVAVVDAVQIHYYLPSSPLVEYNQTDGADLNLRSMN